MVLHFNFISDNYFSILPFHDHLLIVPSEIYPTVSVLPATNVFYSSGLKKEQQFCFYHTQKIDSTISLSIKYNILSAPGLYANQRTNQAQFYAALLFLPKHQLYSGFAGIVTNKMQQKENGGLAMPSEFEDSVIFSREYALVNFHAAERKYNDISFFLKQYFRIVKNESRFPVVIGHFSEYSRKRNVFYDLDPLNSPYPAVLIDSVQTLDSVFIHVLTNRLTLSNFIPSDSLLPAFRYFAEFRYQSAGYRQMEDTIPYFRKSIHGGIIWKLPQSFTFSSNAALYIGEYNKDNFSLDINFARKNNNDFINNTGLSAKAELLDPQFVYQYLNSNHYFWDNNFGPQRQVSISAWISSRFAKMNFSYIQLTDFVYGSAHDVPAVFSETFGYVHADIHSVLKPGKFYIETTAGVNLLPDSVPVRLPMFYGKLRAGIEFPMFHGALRCFFGAEALYFTEFYADTWLLPAAIFRNQDNITIGNYIYPGLFVGINIKRARLFAMLDNAAAGFLDMNYYSMPYYPRFDRFFRWGISWSFYN
jgi:hypothetical protein